MNSILCALKDEKVHDFVENLLATGYARYGIPKEIPKKIIRALEKSKNSSSAIKRARKIPEFKNGESIFWKGRKNYDARKARHREVFRFIKKWLKGKTVLEIGCGTGDLGLIVSKQRAIEKFVGTDVRPLEKTSFTKIEFKKQQTGTKIPIANRSADTILLIDMLHHVSESNQKKLLAEIKTKLKENGAVVFFEYAFSEVKKPCLRTAYPKGLTSYQKNKD